MSHGSLAAEHEGSSLNLLGAGPNSSKVAVCHLASGDRWAGAEVQIASLLRALARRKEFDLFAIILNEGRLASELRTAGIEVRVIPENDKNFFSIVREARRFLLGKAVKVLHSHRYKENLAATALAWRCRIPCVVRTQHGMAEPFTGTRRVKQGLLQRLDRFTARHTTDCVICVSKEMQNRFVHLIKPDKIRIIYNGLDQERVFSELSQEEAKRRLGVRETCWLIGTAGRLDPIKRHDLFLSIAQHILKLHPDTRFLIAGEGGEKGRLENMASNLGILDRVLFLGHRDDIYDLLRAMNVFLLCSDHEGLPMVLLEAVHLGVPVVARKVGGIPEVFENGVSGVLVDSAEPRPLAEACLTILARELKGEPVETRGTPSAIDKFSADHSAAEVSDLYRSLLAAKSILQ
jgi:L-malate glycosyltransferase